MDKDTLFTKIKEILASEFKIAADSISPEKRLQDDLDLDSLDIVDLILSLEDRMARKVNLTLFKNVCTVQEMVDITHSHILS